MAKAKGSGEVAVARVREEDEAAALSNMAAPEPLLVGDACARPLAKRVCPFRVLKMCSIPGSGFVRGLEVSPPRFSLHVV